MHRYQQVNGAALELDYDPSGPSTGSGQAGGANQTNSYGYDLFNRQISLIGLDNTTEYVYEPLTRWSSRAGIPRRLDS